MSFYQKICKKKQLLQKNSLLSVIKCFFFNLQIYVFLDNERNGYMTIKIRTIQILMKVFKELYLKIKTCQPDEIIEDYKIKK